MPIMVSIFVDMVMTSSICIFMAHLDRTGGVSPQDAIKRQVTQVLKNPLPWAILLGVAHSYFQIEFLPEIQKSIGLLSDAASPVALFALGGVLARTSPEQEKSSSLNHWSLVCIKLVIHPAILFVGVKVLSSTALGASLNDLHFFAMVLVLVGGLPSASNVILLSEKLGANGHRLSKVILTTTLLSLLTLPVLSALIQGHLQ
jgi:predicted permease